MAIAGNSQHLNVKSFFAATVREALDRGHQELGPEALLLNAREAPPEARHLGVCEVVLGVAPETGSAPPALMRDSRIDEALVEAGIVPEVARDIDRAVQQRIDRAPVVEMARSGISRLAAETLASQTAAEIASRFEVRPGLQPVTALVGPPGAGKTTTLVKLAVTEGLRTGRSTRLISADTQRIGGAEQLRTFAAILGVPFQAVESTAALAQAIDAAPPSGLVLIDTAGYSKASHDELAGGWAEFFSRRQDIDTHLVLTASMQPLVLRKLVDFYRMYRPSKLLFTRLDEVDSLASLYCEAVQQQMPLSYFGTGQLIPEDLEPAGKERVTESLVRQLPADLRAVA